MSTINPGVDLQQDGEIAVVTIDNPPVNALSHRVRAGLAAALRQAAADPAVRAVVLAGWGRSFSAGADIREFGKPAEPPSLRAVQDAIAAMAKPVVAALHGTVLGGGLELALACPFRIAAADARLGLPEIKLGLVPGAGGTQLLPRLVGPEKALRLILSGEPIGAAEALEDGIVDETAEGDVGAAAVAFARRIVAEGRHAPPVQQRDDKLAAARADAQGFADQAAMLTRRMRGQEAAVAAVEAVRNAFTLSFEQGREREAELFRQLVAGEQSRALRHVFFAELETGKIADMPPATVPRPVARAAVVGAGTMGGGIAMCFANVGIPVTVVDTAEEVLRRGLDRIAANYRVTVSRGGLSAGEMERRMALIGSAVELDAVASADVVIEAVFEEMAVKQQVFAALDRLAKPGALLATNTSTLDVDRIAGATARPQDVVGMHFFSPANVMRLLEIVRGRASSHEALATASALGRRLGKVPVVVGVCYGFVGNRMLARRSAETERLLLEGATPREVDAAVTGFGLPMGPCAMMDLAGLDVGWRIRKEGGERALVEDALAESSMAATGKHQWHDAKPRSAREAPNRGLTSAIPAAFFQTTGNDVRFVGYVSAKRDMITKR
jgi:3-hydroxyacyl-CoA dehydrogenase